MLGITEKTVESILSIESETGMLKKNRKYLCAGLAVLLAVLIAAGIYLVKGRGLAGTSTEERVYAFAINIVKQDLKDAPVSFPKYEKSYVQELRNDTYYVEVHVDTQNRYGMDKEYIYEVCVNTGDQRYTLISCSRRV